MWTLNLLTILYGHIDNKQKYKKKKKLQERFVINCTLPLENDLWHIYGR